MATKAPSSTLSNYVSRIFGSWNFGEEYITGYKFISSKIHNINLWTDDTWDSAVVHVGPSSRPDQYGICMTETDITRRIQGAYGSATTYGWGDNTAVYSLNSYLKQIGYFSWNNESTLGVNSTYSIPDSVRNHNIIIISMRRYGVGGTSCFLKSLITEGAYASGGGIIITGPSNQYWKFSIAADWTLKLLEKGSSQGDPLTTSFGIF